MEEREVIRSATDYYSSILVARAMAGMNAGPDSKPFVSDPNLPGVQEIDTTQPYRLAWMEENIAIPKDFLKGMDETIQLSPKS